MKNENDGKLSKADEALFYQLLETELGGVKIYETAVMCAVNEELREEWTKYLEETKNHVKIAQELVTAVGLDPEEEVPARLPVRIIGEALVNAMSAARESGDEEAAQLAACESVALAETKDHQNWELLGEISKRFKGETGKKIKEAVEEVEDQEDEHLYHTKGWGRELWLQALGQPAVIPPPEEQKDVKSAIGAERAKQARKKMKKSREAS